MHIYPLYKYLTEVIYYLIYYICVIFIIFLCILLFILYVYRKTKGKISWITIILAQIIYILLGCGLIPFMGTLLSAYNCSNGYLKYQDNIECWGYLHIIMIIVGTICIILLLILIMVSIVLFFDNSNPGKNPMSRKVINCFAFELIIKIVVITFLVLGNDGVNNPWVINIIIILSYAYLFYIALKEEEIFHSRYSNEVWRIYIALVLWSGCPSFFLDGFNNSKQGVVIGSILGGSILVVLLILLLPWRNKLEIISIPLKNQKQSDYVERGMEVLVDLLRFKNETTEFEVILKGYILYHIKNCTDEDCQLKYIKLTKKETDKDAKISKKLKKKDLTEETHTLLLEYFNHEFTLCIKKHPYKISLRLLYALFIIEYTKNHYAALYELSECKKRHPSLVEEFIIYRYEQLINEAQRMNKHSYGMTIALSIEYESNFKVFEKKLKKVAALHSQLWSLLSEESPDYHNVKTTGFKILKILNKVSKLWNKLQNIVANIPGTLRLYANFYLYVLNDKTEYKTLFDRSNDYILTRNNLGKFKGFGQSTNDRCNFAADGTPCLYISGQQKSLGNITDCNLALCRQFGYQKSEIITKSMTFLFPPIIDNVQLEQLRSFNKAEAIENLTYGLHRNTYVFPISFKIVDTPNLLNESNFVAMIYPDRTSSSSDIVHILLDRYLTIVGVSTSAIITLDLTTDIIRHHTIRIDSLCKEFRDHGQNNFLGETEMPFFYTFPELIDDLDDVTNISQISQQKRAPRRKISLSLRRIKLLCKMTEINSKEGVEGYCARVIIPNERSMGMINNKKEFFPLEFHYNENLNKYFQSLPSSGFEKL